MLLKVGLNFMNKTKIHMNALNPSKGLRKSNMCTLHLLLFILGRQKLINAFNVYLETPNIIHWIKGLVLFFEQDPGQLSLIKIFTLIAEQPRPIFYI